MVEIRIRREESLQGESYLVPDLVWSATDGMADLALNSTGLDLEAAHGLRSALTIALFSWRRANDYDALPSDGSEPNGWWGDSVDLEENEQPLGSRLWLLLRSTLSKGTEQLCEQYVTEALQPFVTQGAIASFTVKATADVDNSRLTFVVSVFSQSGTSVFDQKYTLLWRQDFPNYL